METTTTGPVSGMSGTLPPPWTVTRPKGWLRAVADFVLSPLRMVALPDTTCERLGLTSLRGERFAAVLPQLRGRCLDVGAGDNVLLRLHARQGGSHPEGHVGVDVVDWGGDCVLVGSADRLPFPDASFDTVCFVACLNHIPERRAALVETRRVLRPGGRVVLTMIGRAIGELGHRLWWYSEDKHRDQHDDEEGGIDRAEMLALLAEAGFDQIRVETFCYGLNTLYVGERTSTE